MRLNEFMAANGSTIVPNAVAGTFNDWIELYNEGAAPVDLGGWHLTDNASNPAKWTFPAGTVIPAGGYRVIFASGNNAPDANGNPHTNFSLGAGGEYLGLTQPDNTVISEFEAGGVPFPPQEEDVSYGRKPGDLSSAYFATATPGAANAANGYLRVAAIQASVKRGFYSAPISVSLTTPTAGAAIYYTLDGSPPLQANGTPAAAAVPHTVPIAISTTTILRSAAVKTAYQPTLTDSQSYIFPADVAAQTRPAAYPATWGAGNTADYAVDPNVAKSAADATRFQNGLRSLPTLSVCTTTASLFGASGIYTQSTNDALEAVVSAEYFQPAAAAAGDGVNREAGFQIDCGLKVQGGSSRNFASSAKHSFSLRFRADVGPGKLDYDLFGAPSVASFNSVQLRAMYNNSWTHSAADQRARATMIPDQWMRDSLLAMGRTDGGHGKFVNLYLNGLFWGVYNLHERIDNDHYAAYQDGVDSAGVFGYNPGSFSAAEQTSFNAMKTAVTGGNWATIRQRLDVDSYIDYYIMQHFGHNDDLKTDGNWRAAGGGSGNYPWKMYLWDSERVLETPTNTAALASTQDGVGIIDTLARQVEFQVRFADRAWKHLTSNGALTNAGNRARYLARVTELDDAITGESARWGDNRTGGAGPAGGDYTRTNNWLPAVYGPLTVAPTGGVLGNSNSWFPETGAANRTATILTSWKTQTWTGTAVTKIPSVDPPAFAVNGTPQSGGVIPAGGTLTLTGGGASQIYVTTDGSDPRQTGGAVQTGLTAYTAGSAIPLAKSGTVRARWFNGTRWSALNEAEFYIEPLATAATALRFSEIHYHPADTSPQEQLAGAALTPAQVFIDDDFQFLEILNNGPAAVNLTGCQLTGGVTFTFGNVALAPEGRAVVVENAAAFAARYGSGITPAGVWSGALSHAGEQVNLVDSTGTAITGVLYSDADDWPNRADGDGSSLEIVDAAGFPENPANWRSSIPYHGTPGTAGPASDGRILVNEVLAHSDPPQVDSIELVNTTAAAIDLSGWFLSDSKSNYRKYRLPPGTSLAAGGYVVFDAAQFNNPTPRPVTGYTGTPGAAPVTVTSAAHGLATGEVITISGYGGFSAFNASFQITVTGADTFTIPTVLLDTHATPGTWTPGQPFSLNADTGEDVWLLEGGAGGKLANFVDHVSFPASLSGESFGRWPDASGPLVPMITRTFGAANSGPRSGPLIISEIMVHPPGTPERDFEYVEIWNSGATPQSLAHWTLRGDADFDFTTESLAANARLAIVSFNPADTVKRDAFLAAWNVTTPITLAGPWAAGLSLGNSSGTVRLRRADTPPVEDPLLYPQVLEDEVNYSTSAPWVLTEAAATRSLNRGGGSSFGNEAASWLLAVPTPGTDGSPVPPAGFDAWAAQNNVTGGPTGDSDLDGVPNLVEYALGLNAALPDSARLPQPVLNGGNLTLTFPKAAARIDATVIVQISDDLSTWTTLSDTLISTADGIETRAATLSTTPDTRKYLRLKVTR
ncbi:MAG: lamin tail domain-containing protein [Verrucomicrobiota bacterium]